MNKSYLNSESKVAVSLKPSKAIRLLLMVLFFCTFGNVAGAATITSTQTGNWNAPSTWAGGVVPLSGDAVVIAANHTVTVNGTFTCASLVIGTNNNGIATLTFSGATPQLTVTGSTTLGNSGHSNKEGALTFTSGSKLVAGSVTNGNNGNNGTITMTAGGTLETGSFAASTGTWIPGTGTVVMKATNTLPATIFTSFNNLTINSGTTTFSTATTITNNFSIATGAIANLGTFTHTAGTLTLGGQGTVPGSSWGSTTSSATNKDNTYFAATTGVVNNGCTTAPTIGTITQPTCSTATGSVVLNGLPSGLWMLTRSPGSVTTSGTGTSTAISGLATGTYTYSVNSLNNGLKGEYFNNTALSGSPVLTRTDATVSFDYWGNGSPDASINNDNFSVRWSGLIQPLYSETYTFSTSSDDGIRLWVNGVQVINNWTVHATAINTGTIALTAGVKYNIVLEYYENWGGAVSQLSWSSASQVLQIIPQSQLYSVASCSSSASANVVINTQPATPAVPTGTAAQSFCSGATVANLSATGTAIQWYAASSAGSPLATTTALVDATHYYATQTVSGCESTTRFDVTATVNATPSAPTIGTTTQPTCTTATGSVVLNGLPSGSWMLTRSPGSVTTLGTGISTTISGLSPGTYTYSINLNNGLKGEYFNNTALSGSPVLTRTDATVNFDWANGSSPDASINNDGFSVRWSGLIQPLYSETYTFTTSSDDGIRLWVNGVQVINNWTVHATATNTGTIALTAGVKYNIVLEYYENTGGAVSKLSWNSTSQALQIIPQSQLYSVASCSSPASANVVINAQPATPSTPIVGTTTHPNCTTSTGSVVLSGLPASGTINQTGTVVASYPITGTTMTISGLATGTYNFSASNGICSSSATGNVVINPEVTNTWTTSWSNGTPNNTQKLVFSGDYPPAVDPNVDIAGCSCMITGGATITIKSGKTLTIANDVTVVGGGTLIFENNASLVQINDAAVNSGNITYKRTTSSVLTSDYTYWSSPVANQQLANVSSSYASGMFYSYDDFATPEGWKKETAATIMQIGKGYIIRGSQISSPPPPPGFYNATFVGVPNNGTKTIAIGSTGTSNLLGNPYPSALDADAFLAANSTLVEGTLYLWTHNTAIQMAGNITNGTAGTGAYAYTSDDYASYNGTGGVAVSGGIIPTGKIAAAQSFFTTSIAAGTVTFNNSMRITGSNSQFFKTKDLKTKTAKAIEKNRIWLNLSNDQGAFKQTLVGYITDATNDYDSHFDGESFDGNEFVDFYSVNQDKNLVIQGRALPFDENDEVPLGFKSTIDGAFTINIDQTDGLLTNQGVFLEDKITNTVFDLKSGNYTFNTVAGTFDTRFVLRYTNKTLAINDFDVQTNTVLVSNKNKQIKINSFSETIDKVTIYDLLGKQIYQKDKVNSNEFLMSDLVSSHQTLLVKTSLQNSTTVTDKIMY